MPTRPNILVILCDQLSALAVGAWGNPRAPTPTIDRLAAEGVRFDRTYTPCPLCQPARPSAWTGRLPHEHGVLSNAGGQRIPDGMPTVGEVFAAAGYDTVHFGKTHDAGALRGFQVAPRGTLPVEAEPAWPINADTLHDRHALCQCLDYLGRPHEDPFLMIADLENPHNICGWIGENQGPHEDVPIDDLPSLPANFETADLGARPVPIQYLCCGHRRLSHASAWTEANYRHYLAAYEHFVRRADQAVATLLETLAHSDAAEDTVVVFLSDHGEGMAAHRMVTKQVSFYEETTRVALIVSGPGVSGAGRTVAEPLVSLCDVAPTVADLAGLAWPAETYGRSLLPWLRGEAPDAWRPHVASEWYSEFDYVITPGRMLRTDRWKYTRYLEGGGEELFDMDADPGETRTLVADPACADVLAEHRRLMDAHLEATGDPFADLEVRVDPVWRRHPVGYANHEGPSAVEVGRGQAPAPSGMAAPTPQR